MSARADALGIDPTIPEDVPQAQTTAINDSLGIGGLLSDPAAREQVVRQTLGDDLSNRYGDALGIRKRGFNDFLRDFSLNMASKDPDKSRAVRQQVLDSFEEKYQRQLEAGRQQRQEAMQKNSAFMDLIERAPKLQLPRKFKVGYVVSSAERIGIPISKEVADLIVDGQIPADVLSMPEFRQALDDDPEGAADMLVQFGADLPTAVETIQQLQQMKSSKQHESQRTMHLTESLLHQREQKLRIRTGKLRERKLRRDLKKGGPKTMADEIRELQGVLGGGGTASAEDVDAAAQRLGLE